MTDPTPAPASDIAADEVRTAIADFLAGGAPAAEVRDVAEGRTAGFDVERWRRLALGVGVGELVVPRSFGGLGAGLSVAAAAIEAAALAGSPAPVRATLTAAAIGATSSDPPAEMLARVATDAAVATVAVDSDGAVDYDHGAGTVSGRLPVVTDAPAADYLVVVPVADDVPVLVVDLSAAAVSVSRLPAVDVTHGYGAVDLDHAPAITLPDVPGAQALDTVRVLVAAELLGVARGALRMAVEYASTREQFGRVIGTYQAVSHRLADTVVDIEGCAALLDGALTSVEHSPYGTTPLPPLAVALAARSAMAATDTAIATLGGIGFTWEHDAHFWFRRARAVSVELGTPDSLEQVAVRRGGWAEVMTG
ncbi:hypothetical protein GCM10009624_12280 [Gordonia sinesedis]